MLELQDVNEIYSKIRADISIQLKKRNVARVCKLIDTFADVAQRVNDIYRDDYIEQVLEKVAKQYLPTTCSAIAQNKRIVFYDQIGSTICLGLQYIRGLIANGYEILYIFESPLFSPSAALCKELNEAHIKSLFFNSSVQSNKKIIDLACRIRQAIVDFAPSRLIIHSPAGGALGCMILYSLKDIVRYRIVPGDHHFYIGYDCIDYFFEFRNFGIKIAVEQRKIALKQIYKLPYYPIINQFYKFEGFPVDISNKICFAAAGAMYKFFGDNWFFNFVKWLLSSYDNCLFLYIGECPAAMRSFIKKERLEGRFIPIGYRKDFVDCIAHIDIFVNSYPTGGGLVCQTAAYFKKPIISYSNIDDLLNRSIRAVLGSEGTNSPISFTDDSSLKEYVDKLIHDSQLRKSEGNRMFSLLQTKENFDKQLGLFLREENVPCHYDVLEKKSKLEKNVEKYLTLQNSFMPTILTPLLNCYKLVLVFKIPTLLPFISRHPFFFVKRLSIEFIKDILNLFKNC